MKIGYTGRSGPTGASGSVRASSGQGGFAPTVSEARESGASARAAAAAPLAGLDALLALQEEDAPKERRRRAVSRAGRMLDELDAVKVGLLEGRPAAALESLSRAVREARSETDDPQLEGLLDEIETRAAVELAKAEMGARRA